MLQFGIGLSNSDHDPEALRLLACAGAWTRLGNTDAVGSHEAGLSPVGPGGGVL